MRGGINMSLTNCIVAASGKAERFGGIFKELLPAMNGKSFLEINLEKSVNNFYRTTLVTNKEKIYAHADLIIKRNWSDKVRIVVRDINDGELLRAVQLGQDEFVSNNCLILADTYYEYLDYILFLNTYKIVFGLFKIDKTERFSTLDIKNKKLFTKEKTQFPAWGFIGWGRKTGFRMDFTNANYDNIDGFFQREIEREECQLETFQLKNYFDIGTPERYAEFVKWAS
jgi:hypothetical protein